MQSTWGPQTIVPNWCEWEQEKAKKTKQIMNQIKISTKLQCHVGNETICFFPKGIMTDKGSNAITLEVGGIF